MSHLSRDLILGQGKDPRPAGWADSIYIREVELQCEFARRAYGEIRDRVNAGSSDISMLAFAHMLLVFASNVTKLVFPPERASATASDRGGRLRAMMGITINQAPSGLVDARNFLEHFEERMDRVLSSCAGGLLIHRLVTDKVAEEIELDDGRRFKPRYLQLLNTASLELTLYDQTLKLHDVYQAVESLQQQALKARDELEKKGVDPRASDA